MGQVTYKSHCYEVSASGIQDPDRLNSKITYGTFVTCVKSPQLPSLHLPGNVCSLPAIALRPSMWHIVLIKSLLNE